MNIFTIILSYLIILFILNIFGFIANNTNSKERDYSSPIYGFGIIIIIENFLFFFIKISTITISYTILILSIFILFYLIKLNFIKKFLNSFLFSVLLGLPIFSFFIFFYLIYGENLIIFRGNHWDYFYYLHQSLIVLNNNFADLMKNSNEIYAGIAKYNHDRPDTFLNIALIKIVSNLDIFRSGFLYKCICISLIANGFASLIRFHKTKIIFAILFPFSFWVFYIYETDALGQLASIPISLLLTSLIFEYFSKNVEISNKKIIKISIVSASLFLIYAEIFFIYLFIFILFIVTANKINIFNYKKIKIYFKILFLFTIFTIPGFDSTYGTIFNKIISNLIGDSNNSWGYYGAFLIGKESIISNEQITEQLKTITSSGYNLNIIIDILKINYLNGYQYFFLNIIPSFFGLFIITIGKFNYSLSSYFNLILIIFFNILIFLFIKRITKNFKKLNFQHKIIFKIVFLSFIFLSLIFFIRGSLWSVVKLYFFLTPFLYLFIILNKDKINYLLILTICLTPLYQYSTNNDGIGKKNSFPSIINADYKNKFNWALDNNELANCNSIKIRINSERYNIHKYNYAALKIYDKKYINLNNNINNNCIITEDGSKFIIIKN